jgi:hypothetical protein
VVGPRETLGSAASAAAAAAFASCWRRGRIPCFVRRGGDPAQVEFS